MRWRDAIGQRAIRFGDVAYRAVDIDREGRRNATSLRAHRRRPRAVFVLQLALGRDRHVPVGVELKGVRWS